MWSVQSNPLCETYIYYFKNFKKIINPSTFFHKVNTSIFLVPTRTLKPRNQNVLRTLRWMRRWLLRWMLLSLHYYLHVLHEDLLAMRDT
ncbi:hypothetical protein evm_004840 [Chilo suppressalis]|nr:hypothetical protein evm_004840 [Chilo suppressalis]